MIVKNEAHVIGELLESVAPYLTYWVIADTGSTDGTQQLVREFFAKRKIPGELHERPWKNFGHNRSEALHYADGKADYLWVIDADDKIVGEIKFNSLSSDCYELRYGTDFTYWRKQLFRSGLDWRYVGVLHEYPDTPKPHTSTRLDGDYHIESRRLGARNLDPQKYRRDAEVLEAALTDEPSNTRYWFYLGQSLFDAGEFARAKRAYIKRASMGGWAEEVYYSLLRIGLCEKVLNSGDALIAEALLRAYEYRPTRAEALYELSKHYREKGQFALATLYARGALKIPFPDSDQLFVSRDVYEFRALDEFATAAYYTPFAAEGAAAMEQLLAKQLPAAERERIEKNAQFYRVKR